MMENFPQLEPLQLRPEAQPGYQKIAWKRRSIASPPMPQALSNRSSDWNCFCCHDTGLVPERLIKRIIPRYAHGRHKPVECNATNCTIQLARLLYTTKTLDERFTRDICDRLDLEERKMWLEWSNQRHEQRKQRLKLVENPNLTKNLRARNRTNDEELEVQRRHQRIVNEYQLKIAIAFTVIDITMKSESEGIIAQIVEF